MKRTTFSAPTIGRSAACLTPPPSLTRTTSGASTSSRPCRSPVSSARWNDSSAARVSLGETTSRGRRASTCRRARCAIWRTAAGALVDRRRDLVVADVEGLAQHEDGALGRRERLEDEHHRHRHALGELDVLGHVRRGEQRLGQPGADVRLLAALHGAQPVERLPGRDPDQVGALVAHLLQVDLDPPQPGLLQDVLGVGRRSEHLVGDGEEQVAVGDEGLGRRVGGVVAHFSLLRGAPGHNAKLTSVSHRSSWRPHRNA